MAIRHTFDVIRLSVATIGLIIIVAACDRTPDHVLKKDEMVELLIDIHKGESVVEMNRNGYRTDSLKKMVKQSVYAAHGVTPEQVDTSLVWYGHHVEKYVELYDEVIARLEDDLSDVDVNAASGEKIQIEVVGDSVDIWGLPRYRHWNEYTPGEVLKYTVSRDINWEKGDIYTWKFLTHGAQSPVKWTIGADYVDGTSDYKHGQDVGDTWVEATFQVDSAKSAQKIFAVVVSSPRERESSYIDSITLVRTRLESARYDRSNIKTWTNNLPSDKSAAEKAGNISR